eukprot:2290163-Rhodomonas_salina.2
MPSLPRLEAELPTELLSCVVLQKEEEEEDATAKRLLEQLEAFDVIPAGLVSQRQSRPHTVMPTTCCPWLMPTTLSAAHHRCAQSLTPTRAAFAVLCLCKH